MSAFRQKTVRNASFSFPRGSMTAFTGGVEWMIVRNCDSGWPFGSTVVSKIVLCGTTQARQQEC